MPSDTNPTTHSRAARMVQGKALRPKTPRSSHGRWQPAADRPDPLDLLKAQDEGRLEYLLPIKYGRMAASPFAFLRGSAVVMAADLASTPDSGLEVMLCGDAHLSNFGLYASPERELVFDLNDFDESYPGPWEWDLKRLAASIVVAARENGFKPKTQRKLVRMAVRSYREAMQKFSHLSTLDMWYYHVDANQLQQLFDEHASDEAAKHAEKMITRAQGKTQAQTLQKMTFVEDGRRRFHSDPPLLVPAGEWLELELITAENHARISGKNIEDMWSDYLTSLPPERQYLLQRYTISDIALRVGGVGSVGTRCFVILLQGRGPDDALILQVKESGRSSLASFLPPRTFRQEAARVTVAQRLMQATSDIFLGWHSSRVSDSDFYWRQLKDMKGSADVTRMDKKGFGTYVAACAFCLARAHARTGHAAVIRGYAGKGRHLDDALADFAVAYADQTEQDHAVLLASIASGQITAEMGV